MSLIKKLAGETALYGLSSILGRVLTFAFLTPFLTRIFADDRAQMGIQTDLYAWTAFLMVLFTYRMETAFFKFGSQPETRPTAYKTAKVAIIGTTTILVSVLILFANPIATWLEYPQHAIFVVWFALILGFDALCAIPFAMLRLESKAKLFAGIKLLNLFIHLGFVLFFLSVMPHYFPNWYDPSLGVGYVFLANLIASAVTFILLLPTYFYKSKEKTASKTVFDKALLKEMLIYSLPLVFAGFAGIVNEVLDRILLKNLLEGDANYRLSQLGVYGACYKLAIFMNLFTQAFNYAAEPFFFRNADKKDARQLYANVALLFALVGCLGFLGIMFFMDIAQHFVAASYREGLVIVPILLIANLCLGLYYNVAIWYKLSGQTKYGAMIAISGAMITVLANLILIPLMPSWGYPGYLGSAWATLLCYATMVGLAYYFGQREYPIPYPVGKIVGYVSLAIGFYLGYAFLLKGHLVPNSIVSYIVSGLLLISYAAIVYLIEGKNLKKIIRSTAVD